MGKSWFISIFFSWYPIFGLIKGLKWFRIVLFYLYSILNRITNVRLPHPDNVWIANLANLVIVPFLFIETRIFPTLLGQSRENTIPTNKFINKFIMCVLFLRHCVAFSLESERAASFYRKRNNVQLK